MNYNKNYSHVGLKYWDYNMNSIRKKIQYYKILYKVKKKLSSKLSPRRIECCIEQLLIQPTVKLNRIKKLAYYYRTSNQCHCSSSSVSKSSVAKANSTTSKCTLYSSSQRHSETKLQAEAVGSGQNVPLQRKENAIKLNRNLTKVDVEENIAKIRPIMSTITANKDYCNEYGVMKDSLNSKTQKLKKINVSKTSFDAQSKDNFHSLNDTNVIADSTLPLLSADSNSSKANIPTLSRSPTRIGSAKYRRISRITLSDSTKSTNKSNEILETENSPNLKTILSEKLNRVKAKVRIRDSRKWKKSSNLLYNDKWKRIKQESLHSRVLSDIDDQASDVTTSTLDDDDLRSDVSSVNNKSTRDDSEKDSIEVPTKNKLIKKVEKQQHQEESPIFHNKCEDNTNDKGYNAIFESSQLSIDSGISHDLSPGLSPRSTEFEESSKGNSNKEVTGIDRNSIDQLFEARSDSIEREQSLNLEIILQNQLVIREMLNKFIGNTSDNSDKETNTLMEISKTLSKSTSLSDTSLSEILDLPAKRAKIKSSDNRTQLTDSSNIVDEVTKDSSQMSQFNVVLNDEDRNDILTLFKFQFQEQKTLIMKESIKKIVKSLSDRLFPETTKQSRSNSSQISPIKNVSTQKLSSTSSTALNQNSLIEEVSLMPDETDDLCRSFLSKVLERLSPNEIMHLMGQVCKQIDNHNTDQSNADKSSQPLLKPELGESKPKNLPSTCAPENRKITDNEKISVLFDSTINPQSSVQIPSISQLQTSTQSEAPIQSHVLIQYPIPAQSQLLPQTLPVKLSAPPLIPISVYIHNPVIPLGQYSVGLLSMPSTQNVATTNQVASTPNQVAAITNQVTATTNQIAATTNQVAAMTNQVAATTNQIAATSTSISQSIFNNYPSISYPLALSGVNKYPHSSSTHLSLSSQSSASTAVSQSWTHSTSRGITSLQLSTGYPPLPSQMLRTQTVAPTKAVFTESVSSNSTNLQTQLCEQSPVSLNIQNHNISPFTQSLKSKLKANSYITPYICDLLSAIFEKILLLRNQRHELFDKCKPHVEVNALHRQKLYHAYRFNIISIDFLLCEIGKVQKHLSRLETLKFVSMNSSVMTTSNNPAICLSELQSIDNDCQIIYYSGQINIPSSSTHPPPPIYYNTCNKMCQPPARPNPTDLIPQNIPRMQPPQAVPPPISMTSYPGTSGEIPASTIKPAYSSEPPLQPKRMSYFTLSQLNLLNAQLSEYYKISRWIAAEMNKIVTSQNKQVNLRRLSAKQRQKLEPRERHQHSRQLSCRPTNICPNITIMPPELLINNSERELCNNLVVPTEPQSKSLIEEQTNQSGVIGFSKTSKKLPSFPVPVIEFCNSLGKEQENTLNAESSITQNYQNSTVESLSIPILSFSTVKSTTDTSVNDNSTLPDEPNVGISIAINDKEDFDNTRNNSNATECKEQNEDKFKLLLDEQLDDRIDEKKENIKLELPSTPEKKIKTDIDHDKTTELIFNGNNVINYINTEKNSSTKNNNEVDENKPVINDTYSESMNYIPELVNLQNDDDIDCISIVSSDCETIIVSCETNSNDLINYNQASIDEELECEALSKELGINAPNFSIDKSLVDDGTPIITSVMTIDHSAFENLDESNQSDVLIENHDIIDVTDMAFKFMRKSPSCSVSSDITLMDLNFRNISELAESKYINYDKK